jgi:transposase InsO family protein
MEFGGETHSDVWGPAPVETKGGKRYYITYTDDKTRFTNLYLLAKKSEAFESYKDYKAWCSTQLNAHIKTLHSDRGGEYLGKEFILHLNSKGKQQKLTVHDTPQHNGVAERRNRTIVERIRALLHSSGLPKSLWGEAARHVVWLMN